jgi:predicted nucleic acid-binding protein
MAGYARYTVVLDACVLYPAPLRDLLLSLAAEELFCARWTDRIHQEWTSNLLAKRPDLSAEKLARTVALMNAAVDDCLVRDYEYLVDTLALPDPDDRHVLAAAIVGHADAIVTFNRRDFPDDAVSRHGLDVLHPDDFLVDQYRYDPIFFLRTVKANRQRLRNPAKSAAELVATYEQQGLPQTCAALREALALI